MIHPTALIHANARIDPTVDVGPYAVIDGGVEIGSDCRVGPHVYITGQTKIGRGNRFFAGCVIGEAPQDLKYGGEPTGLRIGDSNVFREHVTVHRSSKVAEETVIGSNNFLMQHSHVAHNVRMGDHVILASGALLGGYAEVHDRAFLSGNCLVHQFARVGTLALMQGGSGISKDLPPYTIAKGINGICGLNIVGLRRAGFSAPDRLKLKQAYHALFRTQVNLKTALDAFEPQVSGGPVKILCDFIRHSKRGVCADVGRRSGSGGSEVESE